MQNHGNTHFIRHAFCFIATVFVLLSMTGIAACVPSDSIKIRGTDPIPNTSWVTITGESMELKQFKGSWVLLCYLWSYPGQTGDLLAIQDICNRLDENNLRVVVILHNSYDTTVLILLFFPSRPLSNLDTNY